MLTAPPCRTSWPGASKHGCLMKWATKLTRTPTAFVRPSSAVSANSWAILFVEGPRPGTSAHKRSKISKQFSFREELIDKLTIKDTPLRPTLCKLGLQIRQAVMDFYLARMEATFRSSFLYEGLGKALHRFWLFPQNRDEYFSSAP